MERALVEEHLAQAERHVAEGERHIAEQRARITEAERNGLDTAQAKDLLLTFEETQVLHVADRDRLRVELSNCT